MSGDFLDSWALFRTTYLAGAAQAFLLALIGVWVVARDQIFLGAAVAQASTLGIAAALWLAGAVAPLHALESPAAAGAFAVLASVATALLTGRAPRGGRETAEARTGFVFLLAASVPVLLMARSAHGLEEVHRLMFSTLLGATAVDLWIFAALALVTVALVARLHRPLRLFAMDAEMAAAVGLDPGRWSAGIAIWLGLAVGLSLRVSGLLFTFGMLVLPALVAKSRVREVRPMLWIAPAVGVAATALGFVTAHHYDLPPAHTAVALLCVAVAASWALPAPRGRAPAAPGAGPDSGAE